MRPVRPVPPPPGTRRVWGACPHDCPDTCAIVTDVKDTPNGPVAVRIGGDPAHPVTRGALCVKVNKYLDRTYSDERVLHPMRRVGKKGEGRFEPITWDEALGTVAKRLKETIETHGAQSVLPYSYAGTMGLLQYGSMDRRFFHRLGASRLDRTICATAGGDAWKMVLGATVGTDPEAFQDAEVILLWGTNTITSNVHLWPFVKEAQKKGATVVAIDPRRTHTAEHCDEHVAPHPGTDAALAIGMMHVLFRDGLADLAYLERATVGWETLRDRCQAYPPERVDTICGLPTGTTERLARLWGSTKRAVVRLNYGLQRHHGGGNAVRAITCLPAVSGAYQEHSGGALLSTSGAFHNGLREDLLEREALVDPKTRIVNMSRLGEALLDLVDPPVKAIVVYNSNPAAVAPDQERVTEGLLREDLFTVVLEQFPTDTTDYADIVLPATTQLEHADLHTAYGHYYLTWNEPAIPRRGEAKPNTEIFRLLAASMGLDDPAHKMSDEEMVEEVLGTDHPFFRGITLQRLKEEHWVRLAVPEKWVPYKDGSPWNPDGKIHIASEKARALGLDPVPDYTPPVEIPDGEGRTSPEPRSGMSDTRRPENGHWPLRFISPPAHHFLNTTFMNVLARHEPTEPWLEIHPYDADARDITDGDRVRVHNHRGNLLLVARVTDIARPGTVVAPSVWWRKKSLDGKNANILTSERLTDIGRGATFYDCGVEVELAR